MPSISKPIIFFGTDDFSAASLNELLAEGWPVKAVVTQPDRTSGRGRQLTAPIVKQIAINHYIEVWQPAKLTDIIPDIADLDEPVGVLASFGRIIPQAVIDMFTPGIINVHPSLLPAYRGPTPVETAIINGDAQTGVSIMRLSAEMDAGPIYGYTEVELYDDDTGPELEMTLAATGAHLLVELLPGIITGDITSRPQDDSAATYSRLLSKDDGWLKPAELTADQAARRVRAFLAFPKTKYDLNGHTIIITKARASDQLTALSVECANNTILAIDELIAPSGKKMTAQAFLNGQTNK